MSEEQKCDDCGRTDKPVTVDNCPYADEINGELIECQLCEDCFHERCMDI